eukprot:m.33849 g.33849  ORF g.33849 m.33849 type:complete len:281 (+) comp9679_c0_seq2:238-1080(+)
MAFKESAQRFVSFVNSSPSPFHAVDTARIALVAAGFQELNERERWNIVPNGKYFFTRNQSTLVAMALGGQYVPGNGFSIVGAHTDSPCLRVKPNSKLAKSGYMSVGVECYGGGLWNTWFDRDLGLAGRVMVRDDKGDINHTNVLIRRPILRIPNLAIHLNRGIYDKGFKYNKEVHLAPILTSAVSEQLNASASAAAADAAEPTPKQAKAEAAGEAEGPFSQKDKHQPRLISILAEELGCAVCRICDLLCVNKASCSRHLLHKCVLIDCTKCVVFCCCVCV